MARVAVTIWSGKGAGWAFDHPDTRALLDALPADPAAALVVRLHSGPDALADGGAALTARVRAAYPHLEVWWAVAGDAHGPDPRAAWLACARAAVAAGVGTLEVNCEAAWKDRARRAAGVARRSLAALAAAAPGLTLGHTAYDMPTYHSSYCWGEFLGAGSPVAWSAPQLYPAVSLEAPAARGPLTRRLAGHRRRWGDAVRRGWIRADLPVHAYLQAYGCRTDELVMVGEQFPVAGFWAAPTRLRPDGARAMRALAALHARGQTVREFQAAAGLAVDGVPGPKTLAALGV